MNGSLQPLYSQMIEINGNLKGNFTQSLACHVFIPVIAHHRMCNRSFIENMLFNLMDSCKHEHHFPFALLSVALAVAVVAVVGHSSTFYFEMFLLSINFPVGPPKPFLASESL